MEDWTSGYVAEVGYTYGYYANLNPVAAHFALVVAGIVPPKVENACELGFGQGVSINMHAAAGTARWWGTDFNPAQAAFAQSLVRASGAPAELHDEAFESFCARADLPDMDFIGLHGIWSWINEENRHFIVDFVRRKLKVGGVLYISYNTQPGWAAAAPMRELFTDHAETLGAPGQGIISRVEAALAFTEKLMATNPRYAQANPHMADRLKKIMAQDRSYLAHEYFNRDWEPMSFGKLAKLLAAAKLTFACSADFLDHVDSLHLSADQQELLRGIPDARFRQTVRDFCVNAQFRRDFWVRGPRPLTGAAHREALDQLTVVLAKHPEDIALTIGEAKLNDNIYKPFIELLADKKPCSIGEIAGALTPKGMTFGQVLQAVVVLAGKGDLVPTQPADAGARERSARLNRHLMDLSRHDASVQFLASPVSAGGWATSRFDQLFITAVIAGARTPDAWAQHAWQELARRGQVLTKEGRQLAKQEEAIAHLHEMATEFGKKRLDVYRALGIV